MIGRVSVTEISDKHARSARNYVVSSSLRSSPPSPENGLVSLSNSFFTRTSARTEYAEVVAEVEEDGGESITGWEESLAELR